MELLRGTTGGMGPHGKEPRMGVRTLGSYSLVSCLLVSVPLWAQDVYFVCDSTNDTVHRMVDANDDGAIDPATEVTLFYDDASTGPDLSVANHMVVFGGALLVADGGTLDTILRITDDNMDGDGNDDGEFSVFYDATSAGPDLSTPNGMAVASGGAVLVADDGAAVLSVIRLVDANGDGDALDEGEAAIFYDDTAASPAVPIGDPESIAVDESGTVYVGDTSTGEVFRMVDGNGDGDALDAGEVSLFGAGIEGGPLTDIDSLAADSLGGVYAIDEDTGTILYMLDGNADGDAADAGEITIFYDGVTAGALVSDPNDAVLYEDGALVIADGALDALYVVRDSNGDGIASDSELVPLFDDASVLLSTPSGVALIRGAEPPAPPFLEMIEPVEGPLAGGTGVSLWGANLTGTLAVRFGTADAASFEIVADDLVVATTPAAPSAGAVDVAVETRAVSASLIAAFTYLAPEPLVIDSVAPDVGTTAGGTLVAIAGDGWDPAAPLAVAFGVVAAAVQSVGATSIEVVAPAQAEGLVDVTVTQDDRSVTAPGAYRYLTPFLRGDANRDDALGLADAIGTLQYLYLNSGPPDCLDALDVNDDGAIALTDVLVLLGYLFQSGNGPSAPFPAPGFDPTADDGLGCAE